MLKLQNDLHTQNWESAKDGARFLTRRRTQLAAVMYFALSWGGGALAYDSSLELGSHDAKLALDPYVLESDEVVTRDATIYSLSGTTLLQSKLFDKDTGELRDVVIDVDSGSVTDIGTVRAEEERHWLEIHGALDLSLVKYLQALQPSDIVEIVILPTENTTAQSGKRKKTKTPLESTSSAVRKAGIRGAKIYPAAGHVRVQASSENIQLIIAFLPEVKAVFLWEEPSTLGLQAAEDLVQGPLVAAHTSGFGGNLTIAVNEPNACINRNHPDFQFVTFDERIGFDVHCQTGREGLHTTPVAGMLAAIRGLGDGSESIGLYQGHIFDVESGSSTSMYARNPDFINISATTTPSSAKSLDEAVYKQRIFVVNGSGNDSDVARCYSYNALCVGGYHHKNTLGKGEFGDDTPSGSWLNDPESGREEPDVVGTYRVSSAAAGGFGYTTVSGTSFATPSITGLAALLTANFEADLHRDPTLLRAVLMASASHPISNPDAAAPNVPDMNDGIDDRSGSGAPRGDRGRRIMENRHFLSENLDRDADFSIGGTLSRSISFDATRGNTVRVALAWDQCPVNVLSTRDALVADLDMVVEGPAAPLLVCDPVKSPGCDGGSGGGSGSYPGSDLTINDGYQVYAPKTSYSTLSTSKTVSLTSTSLASTSLAAEEPVLAPVEETASSTSTTLAQFALPTRILNKSYFSNPSAVDNYEILEFKAPATGAYRVNVKAARWDQCAYDGGKSTNVAIAWDVLSGSDL